MSFIDDIIPQLKEKEKQKEELKRQVGFLLDVQRHVGWQFYEEGFIKKKLSWLNSELLENEELDDVERRVLVRLRKFFKEREDFLSGNLGEIEEEI